MNYTKGQWVIYPEKENDNLSIWADNNIIANVIPDQHLNHEANANLIAASPELFEALQNLVNAVSPLIHRMGVKKAFNETLAISEARKALKKVIK